MKRWQIIVLVCMLILGVWAIVAHPLHSGDVAVQSTSTPVPPTPTPEPEGPATMVFVGDVMLSRSVGALLLEKDNWTWPFDRIASVTAAADLAFANLETTISTRGATNGCGFCFRSDPRVVAGLVKAGFDVMSVANNHIWDYGLDAFTDTLGALSTADISPVGGGMTLADAREGVVRVVKGTRVGFLAYTNILPASATATTTRAGASTYEATRMKEDIASMKTRSDVVIVSFHAGTEYQTTHNAQQQAIYQAAIDAGADLVVGHHPHVVQEVVQYHNGWIAYSLGNFVFDQNFSDQTRRGLMLVVRLVNKRIDKVDQAPITISPQYQPSLVGQ